jgi:hypothetical protein
MLDKNLLGVSGAKLEGLGENIGKAKGKAKEAPQTRGEVTPQPQAAPRETTQPEKVVVPEASESISLEEQLAEMVKTMDVDVRVTKNNKVNFLVDFSKVPREKVQALSNAISNNDIGVLRKNVGVKAIQKIYKNLLAMKLLNMDREYDRFVEQIQDRAEDLRQASADIDMVTGKEKSPKQKKQDAREAKKALLAAIANPTKRVAIAGLTEEF